MRSSCLVLCLALVAWPLSARAEHAEIDLKLIRLAPGSGTEEEVATAHADQEPPAGGRKPRPLGKVQVGVPMAWP